VPTPIIEKHHRHRRPTLYVATSKDGPVVCDLENDLLLKLNPTALEMWLLLSKGHTEQQIVRSLSQRCQVDEGHVRTALDLLFRQIKRAGLSAECTLIVTDEKVCRSATAHGEHSFPWYGQDLSSNKKRGTPPPSLVLEAFWGLARFHLILSASSIMRLCTSIEACTLKRQQVQDKINLIDHVCGAVDLACVLFPKTNLCLPRTAITTCMLRRRGMSAQMVIGARSVPFQAHAWVEDETGAVVNDFPNIKKLCTSLVRF
jgi:hypothetical protein